MSAEEDFNAFLVEGHHDHIGAGGEKAIIHDNGHIHKAIPQHF